MIDELYEDYEERLRTINNAIKSHGIDKDVNDLLIGINLDIENILTPYEIFKFEKSEIPKRIKEGYIQVFKEGLYLGTGIGLILKLNACKNSYDYYQKCLEEDISYYEIYCFKIDVITKIIPPVLVKTTTIDEHPKESIYNHENFDDIREYQCINIFTEWDENDQNFEHNENIKEMKELLKRNENEAIFFDGEKKEKFKELNEKIQKGLFKTFFESLGVDLDTARIICENKISFNKETAESMFVSPVFTEIDGTFKTSEIIEMYLNYVFEEAKSIGLLNGSKIFLEDLEYGVLDYETIKSMSIEESFSYIKASLN